MLTVSGYKTCFTQLTFNTSVRLTRLTSPGFLLALCVGVAEFCSDSALLNSCFRQLLPGRLDWLGNEHPRSYEDVVSFKLICVFLSSLSLDVLSCYCGTVSTLCACLRSLFFILWDYWDYLKVDGCHGGISSLRTNIPSVSCVLVAYKIVFLIEGLILFGPYCCTADRVGS